MQRYFALMIAIFLAAGFAAPANASADGGCYPVWKIDASATCSSIAALTPNNDTRVNMILLLADHLPASTDFTYPKTDWYEGQGRNYFRWAPLAETLYPRPTMKEDKSHFRGSRCQSYHHATEIFAAEMGAAKLKLKEQSALNEARSRIFSICANPDLGGYAHYYFSEEQKQKAKLLWSDPSSDIKSKKGKEFLLYLKGAKAFYAGEFETALNGFAELTKSKNDWLKETAIYMIGRTEINRAQASAFGEWGNFEGAAAVNKTAIANAERVLRAYVKNFPIGRYTNSAQGFMRRIFWLAGDTKRMVGEYQQMVTQPQDIDLAGFAAEADIRLFLSQDAKPYITDPLLLAVINLEEIRANYDDAPQISLTDLEEQRKYFSSQPELFEFLLASHAFHVAGDAQKVLKLIPDAARQENFSYLQFSRQVLRGLALAKLNDRNEEGFWRDMLSGTKQAYQRPLVELGLARNLEVKGQVDKVFAADSPIEDRSVREILLQHSASELVLRRTARDKSRPTHERDVALFTLLYKQLANGDYSGFAKDKGMLPTEFSDESYLHMLHAVEKVPLKIFASDNVMDEFSCPQFGKTTATLAGNKKNVKARLCLADFIRLNGLDGFGYFDRKLEAGELGSNAASVVGNGFGRQQIYMDIIADPRAKADEKAYALYRAVYCYARTGNNGCGGISVATSQRKAWFRQLKKSYPKSKWAEQLKYYW